MKLKTYNKIRTITSVIIAMTNAQSLATNNYIIPIILIIVSSTILIYFRKKVTEIMSDERDYLIGGKSALLTIQIYSYLAVLIMFILYTQKETNQYFEAIATTLAYSTCILMLMYSVIFRYYNKIKMTDKKMWFTIIVFVLFLFSAIAGLRIFSGEDTWVCKNGQWEKHGQPSLQAPDKECK